MEWQLVRIADRNGGGLHMVVPRGDIEIEAPMDLVKGHDMATGRYRALHKGLN